MPVDLSIEAATDDGVRRLKERAARSHRSLQGEMMAILEDAVREPRSLTVDEALAEIRRRGIHSPSDSVEIIRADRDGR